MRVRRAAEQDFDGFTALLEELGRKRVTSETRDACLEIYRRHLAHPDASHLVVEDDDGSLIACCTLHFRDRLNHPTPDAWIPDLIVTERARRRGAGRALLEESEEIARERGCWALTLESGHQRTEAHAMYESFGMTNMGYYFGKSLDPGT